MQGHTGAVWTVALSADSPLIASGDDGTVRLWDAKRGTCLRTLRAERRYERMDISGLIGITEAQRASLIALGAVERPRKVPKNQRCGPHDRALPDAFVALESVLRRGGRTTRQRRTLRSALWVFLV